MNGVRLLVCGILLIAGVQALVTSKAKLRARSHSQTEDVARPPLYLPQAEKVKLVTLGFDNFVGTILWFNTVNYFGKQYLGQKDYRWLNHMCELVTDLDHRATHVYEFCATLLSWIAKDPTNSNKLLDKAIRVFPSSWRFYYLHGFNNWYFLDRRDLAKEDFERASRLPDAPPFLASLASRLMVATDNPSTAVAFLKDLIEHTSNEAAKTALTDKLKRAILTRDIEMLKLKVTQFEERLGRKPTKLSDLINSGFLAQLPEEPFGGEYQLSPEGEVVNSSGEKRLVFKGKTATTGAMKQEFR